MAEDEVSVPTVSETSRDTELDAVEFTDGESWNV